MTTLIVQLPPALAKRLAHTADQLRLEHHELATIALRLFLKESGEYPPARTGPSLALSADERRRVTYD